MTAVELINNKFPGNDGIFVLRNIEEFMIEFAKYHVQEALKAASESKTLEISYTNDGLDYQEWKLSKESVLNAYDLNNIK